MHKTLYLHLGFHKTGTTSFQHYCARNRDLLLEYEITYPKLSAQQYRKDLPADFENHSIPLFSLFTSKPSKHPFNIINKINDPKKINHTYFDQLSRQLIKATNILISGEDLATLEPHEIISLCKLAEEHGYSIMPFALVRSPYALLNSAIQEQIKNGIYWPLIGINDAANSFPPKHLSVRNDISRIKNLKSIFGKSMRFIPYSTACEHQNGMMGYILSSIIGLRDLPNKTTFEQKSKNMRKSNIWVRLQNQINKIQPLIKDNQHNPAHFKIKPITHQSNATFLMTEKEFSYIANKFENIQEEFRSLLPITFLTEDIKFSQPIMEQTLIAELIEQLTMFNQEIRDTAC